MILCKELGSYIYIANTLFLAWLLAKLGDYSHKDLEFSHFSVSPALAVVYMTSVNSINGHSK